MPEGGIELFSTLIRRGVRVRISTNSLESTDNLQAFSGYYKQRNALLETGIEIYEYKSQPEIMRSLIDRYAEIEKRTPLFAVHAKSMVIDGMTAFVGTFNLDPRSTHLNTEVGVIIRDEKLAHQIEQSIETDMSADNSWNAADSDSGKESSFFKMLNLLGWSLLPLDPIL